MMCRKQNLLNPPPPFLFFFPLLGVYFVLFAVLFLMLCLFSCFSLLLCASPFLFFLLSCSFLGVNPVSLQALFPNSDTSMEFAIATESALMLLIWGEVGRRRGRGGRGGGGGKDLEAWGRRGGGAGGGGSTHSLHTVDR